jgi:hypothetical protein
MWWFLGALIGCGLIWGLIVAALTGPRIECPVPEVVIVHTTDTHSCEPTYGPLPTPADGKEAWGFVCDEGATF